MTTEEITKEIIVSMIQKGHFDPVNNMTIHEVTCINSTDFICKTFSAIAKTVNDCKNGKYE